MSLSQRDFDTFRKYADSMAICDCLLQLHHAASTNSVPHVLTAKIGSTYRELQSVLLASIGEHKGWGRGWHPSPVRHLPWES